MLCFFFKRKQDKSEHKESRSSIKYNQSEFVMAFYSRCLSDLKLIKPQLIYSPQPLTRSTYSAWSDYSMIQIHSDCGLSLIWPPNIAKRWKFMHIYLLCNITAKNNFLFYLFTNLLTQFSKNASNNLQIGMPLFTSYGLFLAICTIINAS